jgi:hypothetical protein
MKNIAILFLALPLFTGCAMHTAGAADDADDADDVVELVSSIETVQAPEEDFPVDTITIYGFDADGNPLLTPPEGSLYATIELENNDGDDLHMRCTQRVIYGCGTTTSGRLMTCSICRCAQLCTGAQEWCSEDMCDF